MKNFVNWLNNATIKRKFLPLQIFVIISVLIMGIFSFYFIVIINESSASIIKENVRNKEDASDIVRNMYVCRVLGRDILFAVDEDVKKDYYDDYIVVFNDLDTKMDNFKLHLYGDQLEEFEKIIEEKNVYKESMILSADIWISGGKYEDALKALQDVTPIATEFFGSMDEFAAQEELLMNIALDRNDDLVLAVLISSAVIILAIILGVIFFIKFFAVSMSSSLIKLERAMSEIAETGNMKIAIPDELYTEDEVGRIANVANKMKSMLLEYSFNDSLTGGYNAKAYHETLADVFHDEENEKEIWCIISDMNNLKIINDNLGHAEGDNALRNSYYALNGAFGKYGKTFRVGGDEFVSILTDCTKDEIKDMILSVTKQLSRVNKNMVYKYSLAIGFDKFTGKTIEQYNDFFKVVDKKMYDNKIASKLSRPTTRVIPMRTEEKDKGLV